MHSEITVACVDGKYLWWIYILPRRETLALGINLIDTHASLGLKQACEKDLVKLTIVDATNEFQLGAVSE